MIVTEAHVRRAADRDGLHCAEVEVQTSDSGDPELLVYFGLSDDDYDMIAVVSNDASSESTGTTTACIKRYADLTDAVVRYADDEDRLGRTGDVQGSGAVLPGCAGPIFGA